MSIYFHGKCFLLTSFGIALLIASSSTVVADVKHYTVSFNLAWEDNVTGPGKNAGVLYPEIVQDLPSLIVTIHHAQLASDLVLPPSPCPGTDMDECHLRQWLKNDQQIRQAVRAAEKDYAAVIFGSHGGARRCSSEKAMVGHSYVLCAALNILEPAHLQLTYELSIKRAGGDIHEQVVVDSRGKPTCQVTILSASRNYPPKIPQMIPMSKPTVQICHTQL